MESKINERMNDLDAIFQAKMESKINERINDLDAKYSVVQRKNMVCKCFYRHGVSAFLAMIVCLTWISFGSYPILHITGKDW